MTAQHPAGRRPKGASLTRQAVIEAAVSLLDESGERGLTFRALAGRLESGSGAIHWHVTNRDELLDLACDAMLAEPAESVPAHAGDELDAIRVLALSLFDTLDRHPWIGSHLPTRPTLPSTLRVLDRIGGLLRSFGVPADDQFYFATAILTYVLGVAAQMTRDAQSAALTHTRDEWLAEQSARWTGLDPLAYPFLHAAAADLREHDDRDQFVAGLDLLVTGIRVGKTAGALGVSRRSHARNGSHGGP
ncbi:TetR/AcrR family transcriptional regulator C-terminal domain-containing protein [Galbitalea sp. SE-J8]|uniref:TetR/AcrR family transcriptional regulator C-terminal domain-containing protein n=1 Tax=Galbitalea sp. SE-J8 TaxID=3054952 RepID=UPI00259D21B2|nr:TetR/AcrR family transcriptional regulator C-terminal domain-containing protein [Galbitalea sp. SE-J8]MDM4761712.1 TetR/AcrR family transcriptional regulator C-terminal domain-containing protein [Galbitalea sp. SE-J8]